MKISVIDIGYYHPSNANWSYNIFQVESDYASFKTTSTFGGDYRLRKALEDRKHKVITKSYANEKFKYRDIKNMLDMDNNMADIIAKLEGK